MTLTLVEEDHKTPDSGGKGAKAAKIFGFIMKNFVSHLLLLSLVAGYSIGGAFLFQNIEMQGVEDANAKNADISQAIEIKRAKLAGEIWMFKWGQNYSGVVDTLLSQYQANFSDAVINHKYAGDPQNFEDFSNGWAFPSALLYTISIVTTIGYGHVYPATSTGLIATILYALVGVPLMLSFLANIGDVMAKLFRLAYGRGCCYFCWKKRKANYELNRQRLRDIREGRIGKTGSWKDQALIDEKGKPKFASGDETKNIDDADNMLDGPTRRRQARSRSPSPGGGEKKSDSTNKNDKGIDEKEQQKDDEFESYKMWEDIEDPDDEVINVPISLTLVIIAAYLFLGAVLFASWNGWTWITGAYFSFVTLSTIGFGDIVPGMSEVGTTKGNIKMAVCYFYIIFGLAVISMSFNLMMEEMLAKFRWLGKKLGIIEGDTHKSKSEDREPLVDKQRDDEKMQTKNDGTPKKRPLTAVSKAPAEFKQESEEAANRELGDSVNQQMAHANSHL